MSLRVSSRQFKFVVLAQLNQATTQLNQAAGTAGFSTAAGDPSQVIGNIIQYALSFLGVIALLLIIYGGYLWMIAQGNEEDVKKAKGILINASIGLFIVFAAYAITYFIVAALSGQTMIDTGVEAPAIEGAAG